MMTHNAWMDGRVQNAVCLILLVAYAMLCFVEIGGSSPTAFPSLSTVLVSPDLFASITSSYDDSIALPEDFLISYYCLISYHS